MTKLRRIALECKLKLILAVSAYPENYSFQEICRLFYGKVHAFYSYMAVFKDLVVQVTPNINA